MVGRIRGCAIILLALVLVALRSQLCAAATDVEMAQSYLRAAEQNDVKSQIYVAALYSAGVGLKQSDQKAFRWFLRAAEQGEPQAQVIVAALYAIGRGVPKNNTDAYRWASLAADSRVTTVRDGAKQLKDLLSKRISAAERAEAMKQTGSGAAPELGRSARLGPGTEDRQGQGIRDATIRPSPKDAAEYYRRGQVRAQRGEYALAIEDFGKVIQLAPNDAEALNNRCWSRAVVGTHLRSALTDCNRALQLRPNFVDALDSRGLAYLKLGELDRAIADYNAVLKLNPRSASSLYGRGIAKLRKGLTESASADLRAARGIHPSIAAEFARYGVK